MRERIKDRAHTILSPLTRLILKCGVSPILISLAALPFNFLAGYLFFKGRFPLAGVFLMIGGFFDIMDGEVARKGNRVTLRGGFLDSTLDRFSEFFIYLGLFLCYFPSPLTILVFNVFFLSLMISYLRARSEGAGMECRIGVFDRTTRVIVLAMGAILLPKNLFSVILWILLAGTLSTVIQRIIYTLRRL